MLLSAIFKALAFYFLFITIRGLLRGYSESKRIKERAHAYAGGNHAGGGFGHTQSQRKNTQTGDVIEADYRVID